MAPKQRNGDVVAVVRLAAVHLAAVDDMLT
jgi:hypothetical protein